MLLEEGVCYDQCIFLAKLYQSLPCFILYSKAKFACYSRCFLTSYFCIPVPYNEKDIFFGCSKRSCRLLKILLVAQSRLALCNPMVCSWDSPGKNTGVGHHSPGDLPEPGIKPWFPAMLEDSLPSELPTILYTWEK